VRRFGRKDAPLVSEAWQGAGGGAAHPDLSQRVGDRFVLTEVGRRVRDGGDVMGELRRRLRGEE
jgi:hypothetical protein